MTSKKIVLTGVAGLLGWHTAARLHAENCAARYRGEVEPYTLALLTHEKFADDKSRDAAIASADAVLHFAGVNRGDPSYVEVANAEIAQALADSVRRTGAKPHIVYANSTHAALNTPYGRSKKRAAEILAELNTGFCDLILPHIFGECARPNYNNITATLIDHIWAGGIPTINPEGMVFLLHVGDAANLAISAGLTGKSGVIAPEGRAMSVSELHKRLLENHHAYHANIFPDLTDPFDLALFNAYRTGGYPNHCPMKLTMNIDKRGALFETSKAMAGSQTFLSTTVPGQTRGDHFHINLVERFVVVSGRATIRVRKVLTDEIQSFEVSGEEPVAIDMPPLHTHHLVNDSDCDVITFFWSHRLFNSSNPDTYADQVISKKANL